MIFEHMDRIVFAGDSVTDMESAQPVGEGLFENVGKSYVRIVENMLAAFYPVPMHTKHDVLAVLFLPTIKVVLGSTSNSASISNL